MDQLNTTLSIIFWIERIWPTEIRAPLIKFDCNKLNNHYFQILVNLPKILKESGEVGEMELEIYKFKIKSLKTYERELI